MCDCGWVDCAVAVCVPLFFFFFSFLSALPCLFVCLSTWLFVLVLVGCLFSNSLSALLCAYMPIIVSSIRPPSSASCSLFSSLEISPVPVPDPVPVPAPLSSVPVPLFSLLSFLRPRPRYRKRYMRLVTLFFPPNPNPPSPLTLFFSSV